jgi:hypothetical protein
MSAGPSDFEGGDLAEVQQETERPELPTPFPAVPVRIDGPVQVQPLPTITGSLRTWSVGDEAERLVGKDPRRATVTLLAQDEPIALGFAQAEAAAGTAAVWPVDVPLVLHTREEVWVRSATPGTPANITVITENWAA